MNIDFTLLSLVGVIGFIIIALVGLIGFILFKFGKFEVDVKNKLKADLLNRNVDINSDLYISAERENQNSKKKQKN